MDETEFKRECLDRGRMRPLNTLTERESWAGNARDLAAKQMGAAERLSLDPDTAELAVGHAYQAMEQKANELLAIAGYQSKSHVCTQAALARFLGQERLAKELSIAYSDRQVYDYTADPGTMRFARSVPEFVKRAIGFVESVQILIEARMNGR
ncbi:MAG: hypothetical protein HY556_11055 [Euryarchaeota archaeon]|nr:hypothetical protein [Euryarchaeota archaeon]